MNIDTTINVTFRCLAESDADYERMDIRSAPTMVIEDRRR
jgi:predicted DsbA family dithiol-disulfide isomerase